MRIAICTTYDLTGNLILNHLLARLSGHRLRFFLANRKRPVDDRVPELAALWGLERTVPLEVLFPLVEAAQPDGPPPGSRPLTFRELGRATGETLLSWRDKEAWNGGRAVADWAPDLILSARFGFLFEESVLSALPGRIMNLHPGALPRYRGQFPVLRAMAAGESQLVSVVHQISPGIDDGAILAEATLPLEPKLAHFRLRWEAYKAGLDVFVDDLVETYASGRRPAARPQPAGDHPMYGWPDSEEFARCREQGLRLLDVGDYVALLSRFRSGIGSPEQMTTGMATGGTAQGTAPGTAPGTAEDGADSATAFLGALGTMI